MNRKEKPIFFHWKFCGSIFYADLYQVAHVGMKLISAFQKFSFFPKIN